MTDLCFAPFQDLADKLIPHTVAERADGSHDISHLHRVWSNVCAIRNKEGGDHQILLAAALLHDCVSVEKNSPLRSSASRLAAAKATDPADPHAQNRPLDDKRYAVDHFKAKVFSLAEGFQTSAGKQMAQVRHERAERFLLEFMDEIGQIDH